MEHRMHLKQEENMECDSPRMTDWKDCICRAVALAMLACFAIFAIGVGSAAA